MWKVLSKLEILRDMGWLIWHGMTHLKRKTAEGNPVFNVVYPKFQLGEEIVREVAVPPTYGMVV